MTTSELIDGILEREGDSYTNDPLDAGGPTRWGITIYALSEFLGRQATEADVHALTRAEAVIIYEHQYILRSGFLHITDERVRVMLIDWAVNCGIATATMQLQRLIGTIQDGVCGPLTLGRANAMDATTLLKQLGLARQQFLVNIVKHDPTQMRFLLGWLNRNWAVAVEPL